MENNQLKSFEKMRKEKRDLFIFGYGLFFILSFINIRLWVKHGWMTVNVVLMIVAVLILLITLFHLVLLRKIYTQWMKGAHFIGAVISGVILTILFYVVFGIAGIFLRILGKDLLDQKIEIERTSYWKMRKLSDWDKNRYTKQF